MAKKVRKSRTFTPYKSYPFRGQDPMVGKIKDIFDESGEKLSAIHEASGVSTSTIGNWFNKKTMRPQVSTVNAVLMAMNKELAIVNKR